MIRKCVKLLFRSKPFFLERSHEPFAVLRDAGSLEKSVGFRRGRTEADWQGGAALLRPLE